MVSVVFAKTAVSLIVILCGWLAASWRRGQAGGGAAVRSLTSDLSRLMLDVSLPSLAFTQILKTTTPETLRDAWYVPVLGFAMLCVTAAVGAIAALFASPSSSRRSVVFLVAIANWIYLPLPIAAGLYGPAGTRTVLLSNVGSLLWLWTIGVWILHGHLNPRKSLRAIVARPGLWATLAGLVAAIYFPSLGSFDEDVGALAEPARFAVHAILQAMEMAGSLTVPLALLVTGAQLAELKDQATAPAKAREMSIVVVGRLVLAPLVCWALLSVLPGRIPHEVKATLALIAAMPVAVSSSMFTRDHGGDDGLAATAIVVSTMLSLVTVPGLLAIWPQ